jgi:ribosomal protein S18 acetylase RimI-like enzyme
MNEVVRLDAADIDELAPLWQALQAHHAERAPHLATIAPFRQARDSWEHRRAQYLGHLAGELPAALFISRAGGKIVGYAMVRCTPAGPTLQTGELVGHLDSLIVVAQQRSAGHGRHLLDTVWAVQDEWQTREITVNVMAGNARAEQLYRRRGMLPFSTSFIGRV